MSKGINQKASCSCSSSRHHRKHHSSSTASSGRVSKVATTISYGPKVKPPPRRRNAVQVLKSDPRGLSDPLGLPKNVDGTYVSQPITPLAIHQHQLIAGNGPTGLQRFQTRAALEVHDQPTSSTRLLRLIKK
jgi:hypothetical protein